MSTSRRAFLQRVSSAAALGLLAQLPGRRLWATAPIDLMPEPDAALLRELALVAVDEARAAGASFADVRIGSGREVEVSSIWRKSVEGSAGPMMVAPRLQRRVGYGVRAIVDGAWGFATGHELTREGVRRAARSAVAHARANRPRHPRTLELAPEPRAQQGEWATPIEQDPFIVPLGDQADRQIAAIAGVMSLPDIRSASADWTWRRAVRVFASTDGTVVTQRLDTALPYAGASASTGRRYGRASADVPSILRGGYGYEAVARVNLTEELRRAAERAVAEARAIGTPVPADVGRCDLVFAADAVAMLLARTLAEAVNAERALGYLANREGTSFAAPPGAVLGTLRVGSPLLTVRADRTRSHGAATVGWDDEGTAPGEFTVIRDGVVYDYLTTRQTGVELAAWYRSRREPVRSRSCASGAGQQLPSVQLPNLTVAPGTSDLSVDDLIAGTQRGYYIAHLASGGPDQQVLNSQFSVMPVGARVIRNGKLGDWVTDLGFQFITPRFWRNLDALGGSASAVTSLAGNDYWLSDDPIQLTHASVTTVPARFREVNVLSTAWTG